jgi:L-aminopeptidase/D-esterase-like protein
VEDGVSDRPVPLTALVGDDGDMLVMLSDWMKRHDQEDPHVTPTQAVAELFALADQCLEIAARLRVQAEQELSRRGVQMGRRA